MGQSGVHESRVAILELLFVDALTLALSACGCRVVQQVIEIVGGEERARIVERFRGNSLVLLDSPHGNHVLQKCIEVMPPCSVRFILDELVYYQGGWGAVAKHRFGCRVVERLLEHCPEEMTSPLLAAVIPDTCVMCRHSYGNYVVQHILEYSSQAHQKAVITELAKGDVAALTQHRIASNVIEKALTQCSYDCQQLLASAILHAAPSSAGSVVLAMACSRYGIFTVKRLLEVLKGPMREKLLQQLSAGAMQLRASKHGKELLGQLVGLPDPGNRVF